MTKGFFLEVMPARRGSKETMDRSMTLSKICLGSTRGILGVLYTRTTGTQTMLCRTVITVGIKGVSGDQGGSKIRVTRGRDQGRDLGGSIGSMKRCQGRSGEDPGKIHEI